MYICGGYNYFQFGREKKHTPVPVLSSFMSLIVIKIFTCDSSIYIVHDEVKDKNFELELSWVGEGNKVKNCLDGYFGKC